MAASVPVLRWEPELLGRVVADELARLANRGEGGPANRYRAAAEPLYDLSITEREEAFYELDLATLDKLDLARVPLAEIARVKWPSGRIQEVFALPAASRREEGADIAPHRRTRVLLRIRPSRFADRNDLAAFCAHELAHMSDLISPEFGYSGDRQAFAAGSSEHLVRDRYRSLWCASIDLRGRRVPASVREARIGTILKLFALSSDDAAALVRWLAQPVDHASLLACAEDPCRLAAACPGLRGTSDAARTRCPVCKGSVFPSCPSAEDLSAAARDAVIADVPGWRPEQGICDRCRETYLLAGVPS